MIVDGARSRVDGTAYRVRLDRAASSVAISRDGVRRRRARPGSRLTRDRPGVDRSAAERRALGLHRRRIFTKSPRHARRRAAAAGSHDSLTPPMPATVVRDRRQAG